VWWYVHLSVSNLQPLTGRNAVIHSLICCLLELNSNPWVDDIHNKGDPSTSLSLPCTYRCLYSSITIKLDHKGVISPHHTLTVTQVKPYDYQKRTTATSTTTVSPRPTWASCTEQRRNYLGSIGQTPNCITQVAPILSIHPDIQWSRRWAALAFSLLSLLAVPFHYNHHLAWCRPLSRPCTCS